MNTVKKVILVGLILFLFLVTIVTFYINSGTNPKEAFPEIASILPAELSGWDVTDYPIADSEEMQQVVDEALNFDAAIFREYKQNSTTLSVYIAYWKKNKSSFRSVSGHTPDVCWVQGGWKATSFENDYIMNIRANTLISLKPGQRRIYERHDQVQYVLFWQLLDGEPFSYGTNGLPPKMAFLTDIITRGFNQKPQQWFIRIASNRPFEELENDEGYRQILGSLEQVGLFDQ